MAYSLVAGSALALVSLKSGPMIERNMLAAEETARVSVLPGMTGGFESVDGIDGFRYWKGFRNAERTEIGGYVFVARGKGYSSVIESMVGVDVAGNVTGVDVLFQQETPGLGDRVNEIRHGESVPWFPRQFAGISAGTSIGVDKDGGTIDSITGATISSRAMTNSIYRGLVQLKDNVGGFR
jgi:electron transport complex protein RnfG